MASTHKHLRSSTANKRPTTAIAEGQIALNTNSASPGLFFKDSTGASIIKVGPVHVGTTAPNVTPPSGGSSGNSTGEVWLDTSLTPAGVKIWNGSAWVNATPVGSTTVQGLLELATNAETQTGTDTERAVTPAALQSKMSDSATTSSSTTIASSTAVKTAYDLANAALPRSGGTITGNLEIGTTGSLSFEGSTADAFETTIAVTDPTADRTITLPDTTGTVVTTGDSGTVTSTMIADGAIVDADVNASAAIAGTKISPNFGSQNTTTTGTSTAASFIPSSSTAPTNGLYLSGTNTVALATASTGRLFVDASGRVGVGIASPQALCHLRSDADGAVTHLYLQNRNAGANAQSRIAFTDSASDLADGRHAYIGTVSTGAGQNGNSFVIATNPNGGSAQECVRITSGGYLKASNNGSYRDSSGAYAEILQASATAANLQLSCSSSSYTGDALLSDVNRAAATDFYFYKGRSSYGSDWEFALRGDGNAFADGSWTGGGADYAEYFEWSDGNPDEDDRRGIAVVLDGEKIRPAVAGEDPIGVISGNPSVVGDAAWNKWSGKYLRDEFGTYILEDYEVEDEDGNTVLQQRRKLNPAYDPDVEYVSREERPEWDCVGLMGKLRLRKGQPTGSRWIKMRDISDNVEEWLVR